MPPANETQLPQPSPTSHPSPSTTTSLSSPQDSQWGPSGIGTVVFGCVASILGLLALWMTFWTRQKESGQSEISEERVDLRRFDSDATASNDDVSLEYLPHGEETDTEAMEGSRGDAVADTQA